MKSITPASSVVGALLATCLLFTSTNMYAAEILFVSDFDNDENIATVLAGDGHNVTTVINDYVDDVTQDNVVLQGDLSAYGCVVWSASGEGYGDEHAIATINNLTSYVSNGGTVLVTGYDSIASPEDLNLIQFLGGTGSYDTSDSSDTGPVTGSNILSTGVINIVGVTPTGGHDDTDALRGLGSDTVCVATNEDYYASSGDCSWSLRTVGAGQVAYITNGDNGGADHPSWENTSLGGAGAYNAALRNFAFNCGAPLGTQPTQPVPTLSIWAAIVMAALFILFAGIPIISHERHLNRGKSDHSP